MQALFAIFCSLSILSLINGKATGFSSFFQNAVKQTIYEQEVEDINSVHKIDNHLVRRLIVMPLNDNFNPNQADPMHNKIQYGDRCSLPASLGRLIFDKRYEVPWLFEIKPVNKVVKSNNRDEIHTLLDDIEYNEHQSLNELQTKIKNLSKSHLEKAYVSPLDFRSPENYIFLPQWLMHDLGLNANDLVDISFVRIKLANLVVFQPLSLEWDSLMEEYADPKGLLEHEINKYSSLTTGSTIYIEVKGTKYPLYVRETVAEGDISVTGVRVMDSDVKTDIDRKVIDALIDTKKAEEEKKATKK